MKRLNPARKLQVVIPKGDPVYRACSESGMASRQSGKRRPKP